MPTREDLDALIARVGALTGADREVDLAIAQALVPDVIVLRQRDDDSGSDPYTYWQYTSSLDAVLALAERVLPGWRGEIRFGEWPAHDPRRTTLWSNNPLVEASLFGVSADSATPALALLLAVLRAYRDEVVG